MTFYTFSYAYYCNLIRELQKISPLKDFSEVQPLDDSFFILRHDVEFSVERAFDLAKLEHDELGIRSSYFFQIRNNTYNLLSRKNIELVKEIHMLGHAIGLHVNALGLTEFSNIIQFIRQDLDILSQILGMQIDRFSFHRPTAELLRANLQIDSLINAYDKKYFHFEENFSKKLNTLENFDIYYFSDSEHSWKFGHPGLMKKRKNKKFQLLIHPYSWSLRGGRNLQNFKSVVEEKYAIMIHSMAEECHHFPQVLLRKKKYETL